MLLMYADNREDLRRAEASLVPHLPVPVRAERSWSALSFRAGSALCVLLLCLSAFPAGLGWRLRSVRRANPRVPTVLVTGEDPELARRALAVPVDRHLALGEAPTALAELLVAPAPAEPLLRLADAIEREPGLSPLLREAMVRAAREAAPFRSLHALASAVGCSRSALWSHWRRHCADPTLRAEDYLDWLLLLRALAAKEPATKWTVAADVTGLHVRTLGRLASRLSGRPLSALEGGGAAVVLPRFSAVLAGGFSSRLGEAVLPPGPASRLG